MQVLQPQQGRFGKSLNVPEQYHDLYDGERPYQETWREYFCEHYTTDLIRAIWGWSPPYKLLDCGSASGLTLEAFANLGVEAWGVESSHLDPGSSTEIRSDPGQYYEIALCGVQFVCQ